MEKTTLYWAGGIVLAIAALFAFIFLTNKHVEPVPVDINSVSIANNPIIGNNDANVTIAYWSDYQCPSCKQFDKAIMPNLIADYIDTGKVKVVFKDFSFLGAASDTAALAGRAVWELAPEKFPAWRTAVFEKQDAENAGWGSREDVLALTGSLGIDAEKIGQMMNDKAGDYKKLMDQDRQEGIAIGVQGTPSVVIGNQLIFGMVSYDKIKALIETELSK